MKFCPRCGERYLDSHGTVCWADGARLIKIYEDEVIDNEKKK